MKRLLLFLSCIGLFSYVYGEEIEQPHPEMLTPAEDLRDISDLMVALEDELNEDYYQEHVQLKGEEIEERLKKLIDEYEEREKNVKKVDKPPEDSHTSTQRISEQLKDTEIMATEEWRIQMSERELGAKLGKAFGLDNIDLRWRSRIAAYFLSVNDSNTKKGR